jgi:SagB-type dehydrogenase family enzyme
MFALIIDISTALLYLLAPLSPIAAEATDRIALAPPAGLSMSLGDALSKRHSVRSFDTARAVSRDELGTVLWAAAGITRVDETHPQGGKRTAPSAFGSASVDVYVTSAEGTFRYASKGHALEAVAVAKGKDLRSVIAHVDWMREAPVVLVLVADFTRYPAQAGQAERRDYAHADAAAAGENLYRAATALGLGTCLTMSSGSETAAALGLAETQKPIFVFPLGREKALAASGARS